MQGYSHKVNVHRHKRKWLRVQYIVYGALFLVVILSVAAGVYISQQSHSSAQQVVIQKPVTSYRTGAPLRTFGNEKFMFKSSQDWQFSRLMSRDASKYVYFQQNNNNIAYELDIYFDKSISNQAFNYIFPVTVQNGMMKTLPISERCGNKIQAEAKGKPVVGTMPQEFGGVKYNCDVLGSKEVAAAGISGGSYNIPLYDSKGQLVEVELTFTNNTSSYFPTAFKEIIENFKLK